MKNLVVYFQVLLLQQIFYQHFQKKKPSRNSKVLNIYKQLKRFKSV